jgi:hypothetical protein
MSNHQKKQVAIDAAQFNARLNYETRTAMIKQLQDSIPKITDGSAMRAELAACNVAEIRGFMSVAGIDRHGRELKPYLIQTIVAHYLGESA